MGLNLVTHTLKGSFHALFDHVSHQRQTVLECGKHGETYLLHQFRASDYDIALARLEAWQDQFPHGSLHLLDSDSSDATQNLLAPVLG